jgi:hypothetical protein
VNRGWYIAGVIALIAGAAIGWFVLRPLPRAAVVEPGAGYLIIDSTAASENSGVGEAGGTGGSGEGSGGAATSAGGADSSKDVILDMPAPGSTVTSPLWVVGQARGTWYFEAEFPIRLLDANDTLITWASGRAKGEWTTHDYVPFVTLLNFKPPTTATGTLVLERSNPSGLPGNEAEVRIPVRFR